MGADIGPGDFVECVDASLRGFDAWEPGAAPTEGAIYTVRAVFLNCVEVWALRLEEIERGPDAAAGWGGEVGYAADRFRPVYRPKSEIIESLKTTAPKELEPA